MKYLPHICTLLVLSTSSKAMQSRSIVSSAPEPTNATTLWVDLDGDGDVDVYSIAPDRADVALRNLGPESPGQFLDATVEFGLSGSQSRSAQFRDLDGDGNGDLLLKPHCCGLQIFSGSENGTFVNATPGSGLAFGKTVESLQLLDVDGDLMTDLALGTAEGEPLLLRNLGGLIFEPVELQLPSRGAVVSTPAMPTDLGVVNTAQSEEEVVTGSNDAASVTDTVPTRASGRTPLYPDATGDSLRINVSGDSVESDPDPLGLSGSPFINGTLRPNKKPYFSCALGVRDQAKPSDCLSASTDPTMGMLYPLSEEFFIDSSGRVGIGTSTPSVGLDVFGVTNFRVVGSDTAVSGYGSIPPTNGYLGVHGTVNYDDVLSADWFGLEIGAAGISTGTTDDDNYGVMGHSNGVGVRGEHSLSPDTDYAELGLAGIGLEAAGTSLAGNFLGNVDVDGALTVSEPGGLAGDFLGDVDVRGQILASVLAGTRAAFFNGDVESKGTLSVVSSTDVDTFELTGGGASGGFMSARNAAGTTTFSLDPDTSGAGFLRMYNSIGGSKILLDGGATDGGGDFTMAASDGSSTIFIDANDSAEDGGLISVRNDTTEETVAIVGDNGANSGRISLYDRDESNSFESIRLNAQDSGGTGSEFLMLNESGTLAVDLDATVKIAALRSPLLRLYEEDGSKMFELGGDDMRLFNSGGVATIAYDRQTGSKSCVVDMGDAGLRKLYAMESPEIWFEDFGTAQLIEGRARIELDPMFLANVVIDEEHPCEVFVTLTSPALGIWVEKGDNHFIVHELGNGTSGASFDWRIVAKRKGVENRRFDRLQPKIDTSEVAKPRQRTPMDAIDGELGE